MHLATKHAARSTQHAYLLYQRAAPDRDTITLAAFRERYGFEADGANVYYGVEEAQVQRWQQEGERSALAAKHRAVLEDVRDALLAGERPAMGVDFSLMPRNRTDPYGYLSRELPQRLLGQLARELHAYQQSAATAGKRLEVFLRYASEMNDPAKEGRNPQPWGRRPGVTDDAVQQAMFKETFRHVRDLFRREAPGVRFAVSPALRQDITGERYAVIEKYWPGDAFVDVVGCTWYVGEEAHFLGAAEVLRQYCRRWKETRKPFGLDEIGGQAERHPTMPKNDAMLRKMFAMIGELKPEARFAYVSLFLTDSAISPWGRDATLSFLRDPGQRASRER